MRNRRNTVLLWSVSAVLLVGVIALLTWQNYRFSQENPGGNDFLVHWMGTRTFLTEGISPYSDETALRIQTMAYGRPAEPGEHQLRVAYPLYSMVVFFPFALISDYTMARAVWMTVLELSVILLAVLCIQLTRWRPNLLVLALFIVFSIFWYHAFRPLILGNAVVVVTLLVVCGFLALRAGGDELAGILFAFATIKPQVVVLLIGYIVIWSIFSRRWRLLFWMVGTVFLLSAISALLLPDWIVQNLREIVLYPKYNPPGTLGSALAVAFPAMGERIARIIYGLLAGMLLAEWWLGRRADFRSFLWTSLFTLVISQWIGIQTDPGNFIVLFPAVVLVFSVWEERWRRLGRVLVVTSMLLLFFGIWALFLATVDYGYQPQQSPIMFFPLPAFLIVTLYWIRWWAMRPPSVWFDLIYQQENP